MITDTNAPADRATPRLCHAHFSIRDVQCSKGCGIHCIADSDTTRQVVWADGDAKHVGKIAGRQKYLLAIPPLPLTGDQTKGGAEK